MPKAAWALLALCLALAGCRTAVVPNPNDPAHAKFDPDIMIRNMDMMAGRLDQRVQRGELSSERRDELLRAYIDEQVATLNPAEIPINDETWKYGDIFRRGQKWEEARDLYKAAAERYPTLQENGAAEDRRVNDTLRWAHMEARLGNAAGAVEIARRVFDTPPAQSAPILPATLFEIVPNGRGKGADRELAELLEAAIEKHLTTQVNAETPAGQAFLQARPFLIRDAWRLVLEVYQDIGDTAAARAALERSEQMMMRYGSV